MTLNKDVYGIALTFNSIKNIGKLAFTFPQSSLASASLIRQY